MNIDEQLKIKQEELIYQAELDGANKATILSLVFFGISALLILIITLTTKFYLNSIINIIGLGSIFIYKVIIFFILKANKYKKFIKYITATSYITVTTFILYGYSFHDGILHSLRTVAIICYVIMIISSGFYLRPAVPIYSAVLACIQYTGLFLFGYFNNHLTLGTAETFYEPVYSIQTLEAVIFMLILSGAAVSFITSGMRRLITRSINAEKEVYKATIDKKAMEESAEMKLNFFINIAHETKTPLTIINSYLEKDIAARGESENIFIARDNLKKLMRNTVNFIDSEKLEKGLFIYNHEQLTDVSLFTDKKINSFTEIANKKNIRISKKIKHGCISKIDPFALDRILNNLLDNAIKFSDYNSSIIITLSENNNFINISVKDHGIGIPENEQENIFKPFYQIFHIKKNMQGIGLGLYLVKRILSDIKGDIELNSTTGKGSEFTVKILKYNQTFEKDTIPDAQPSIPLHTSTYMELAKEEYDENKFSIFIVEDNVELLAVMQSEFNSEFNIFTAFNGKSALEKLRKIHKPDLIISDIMMPEMDGEEFYSALQSEPDFKDIPFIFLTAKSGNGIKTRTLKNGVIDFISKPFDLEELKSKIDSILMFIIKNETRIKNTIHEKIKNTIFKAEDIKKKNEEYLKTLYIEYNLSPRKREICELLIDGLYNKEIAYNLKIEEKTVEKHLTEIYKTLNVSNRLELFKLLNNLN